jgi:hypothetical protein
VVCTKTRYNGGMSDERKTSAGVSIGRIARMTIGTAIAMLIAFWIVYPFVVFGGPAMTKWPTPGEYFRDTVAYMGLLLLIGTALIRVIR